MTSVNLKMIRDSADSVVWASPRDIGDTVRYKRTMTSKQVGKDQVPNVRQELIANRTVPVALCDKSCPGHEVLSVRTAISGSFKSRDDMVRLVRDHIAHLTALLDSEPSYGFGPGDNFAPSFTYKD